MHCGDFAIAAAWEIAGGCDPADLATKQWDQAQMREHLLKCFEDGKMTTFPVLLGKKANRVFAKPRLLKVSSAGMPAPSDSAPSGKRKRGADPGAMETLTVSQTSRQLLLRLCSPSHSAASEFPSPPSRRWNLVAWATFEASQNH